jgi:hypothetical protein
VRFFNFQEGRPAVRILYAQSQRWRQDELSASVLFLSPRHMVAPRFEDLSGFDGVAYRTPLLLGRTRSSDTGFVLLSMTIVISGPKLAAIAFRNTGICDLGVFIKIPERIGKGRKRRRGRMAPSRQRRPESPQQRRPESDGARESSQARLFPRRIFRRW